MSFRKFAILTGGFVLLLTSQIACTVTKIATVTKTMKDGESYVQSPFTLSATERSRALQLAAAARNGIKVRALQVMNAKTTKEVVVAAAPYPAIDDNDNRRLAAVTSFNYGTGQAVRTIINLNNDQVIQTKVLPGSSAPAGLEEITRIKELLANDSAAYHALFETSKDNYDLGIFAVDADDDELAGHRLLLVRPVYFRAAPDAPIAMVDLTADRVLRYED